MFARRQMDTSSIDPPAAAVTAVSPRKSPATANKKKNTTKPSSPDNNKPNGGSKKKTAYADEKENASPSDVTPMPLESSRSISNSSGKTPVSYLRAGTGAFNAKSTVAAHAAARKDFNSFLESKQMGSIETLEEEDVALELLQEYGGYLINRAVKASDQTLAEKVAFLKSKTALQYVSGVVVHLSKRFPHLDLREDSKLYEVLRADVEFKINNACCKMVRSNFR
jgi:hypothetical protein